MKHFSRELITGLMVCGLLLTAANGLGSVAHASNGYNQAKENYLYKHSRAPYNIQQMQKYGNGNRVNILYHGHRTYALLPQGVDAKGSIGKNKPVSVNTIYKDYMALHGRHYKVRKIHKRVVHKRRTRKHRTAHRDNLYKDYPRLFSKRASQHDKSYKGHFKRSNSSKRLKRVEFQVHNQTYPSLMGEKYSPADKRAVIPKKFNPYNKIWVALLNGGKNGYAFRYYHHGWILISKG